jgi:hypothetical protein
MEDEIHQQTYSPKQRHDGEYADSLKSPWSDSIALRHGVQLLATAFAVVCFLRVLETARWAEHTFLRRKLECFPASTL